MVGVDWKVSLKRMLMDDLNKSGNQRVLAKERKDAWETIYLRDGKRYGTEPSMLCKRSIPFLCEARVALEIGCGYGRDVLFLAASCPRVHYLAIDSSETAISMLLSETAVRGFKNVEAFTADLTTDSTHQIIGTPVDVVISHFLLHLFLYEERNQICMKMFKLLEPGGLFVFSVVSDSDEKFGNGSLIEDGTYSCYPERPWHFLHFWNLEEIHSFCDSACFRVEVAQEYVEEETILGSTELTHSWFVVARKLME